MKSIHQKQKQELAQIAEEVRKIRPLVHSITNYVTVNDCANALLAIGASPVMADAIEEMEDIAGLAGAVVLNIGTLNVRTVASMMAAGKRAGSNGRPVILDPVGAGASRFRTETAQRLASEIPLAVIRGNVSEIKAMAGVGAETRGVDAADADVNTDEEKALDVLANLTSGLARKTGAVVVATGRIDVVSDGTCILYVANGHPLLPQITGSGCMLSAIVGAFCATIPQRYFSAVTAALCAMGIAGELAGTVAVQKGGGLATFRNLLIDSLTTLDTATLASLINVNHPDDTPPCF